VRVRFWVLMLLACAPVMADLAQIRAEPNLEKRAHEALDNAERALKACRKAYDSGDLKETQSLLDEVKDSVSLADESLTATGKNPIKSPRHFKYAEIKTEDLLRKLNSLWQDMNVADRPMIDPVKARLQEVHESLLQGIMMGKKK
jgi:uncharacterized protein YoxC